MATPETKIVYLMRGLPACGKSHTALRLARPDGLSLETDQYFYTQVGEDPGTYDYRQDLLPAARQWNFERFRRAIAADISPIVVDRGNGLNRESQRYARYALEHGYQVALREPDSPWWQEIRVLLAQKPSSRQVLYQWADVLAEKSRPTHRVPATAIRRWMDSWKSDLTIEELVNFDHGPR